MSEIEKQRLVIVTGPSGAGRSTAINALEDQGFESVDNLPLNLLPRLIAGPPLDHSLVVGVDARTRDFSPGAVLQAVRETRGNSDLDVLLLYMDCARGTLLRRYSETRRRHPLAPDAAPDIGLDREFELLGDLRDLADLVIDTSDLSPHDLKAEIGNLFSRGHGGGLTVSIMSFSYKKGIPRAADMVIDARFLRNPHWDESLRPHDGTHESVAEFVRSDPRFEPFVTRLADMLNFLLPEYAAEGKAYFTLAIGCTGGRHRSVMIVQTLANMLELDNRLVSVRHRDCPSAQSSSSESKSSATI